jgi:hypothetical protein
MSVVQSTHQFADAATARILGLRRYVELGASQGSCRFHKTGTDDAGHSEHCELHIRQKPKHAKVAVGKEKGLFIQDPICALATACR